jgi:hypothetical protein
MNEEPKSIWRRSWTGPLGFFLWVISLTIVISIIAVAAAWDGGMSFGKTTAIPLVVGLAVSCITLLWIAVVAAVRWFFRWRNLRRVLFALVCLATLVALFYAEENWRGQHAWKKFKTEWEAKGKRCDLAILAPPPVPDDQNFAMAPVLVEAICASMGKTNCRTWYGDKVDALDTTNLVSFRLEMPLYNGKHGQKYPNNTGGWQRGEKFGLKQWQDYFLLNKWHDYYRTIDAAAATNSALSDGNCGLPMVDPATGLPLAVPPQDDADTNTYSVLPEPRPCDDLKTWQRYYLARLASLKPDFTNYFPLPVQSQSPAGDVLLELSRFDSPIEELRYASQRAYSRFPICYNDANPSMILIPHLGPLKWCSQVLQLRAVAELQAGQTAMALDDIKLMLRLTESVRTEPFIISHLVRIAIEQIFLQPVWEGLADHRWTDAQLAALDAELGKLDFLADYDFVMQGEMAMAAGMLDYFRRTGELRETVEMFKDINSRQNESATNLSDQVLMGLARFGPGGWFDQNKVAGSRMRMNVILPIVNRETRTVSPALLVTATNAYTEMRQTPCNWLGRLLFSGLFQCPEKFAYGQWSVDAARIACALERYRLANGNYPDKLDALVPQFLRTIPHDLINGQLLRYRRTNPPSPHGSGAAGGRFILYSVGWNETDDGGKIVFNEKDRWVDRDQGDWVWQMPDK